MIRKNVLAMGILFLLTFGFVSLIPHEFCQAGPDLGNLHIPFVLNEGQVDDQIKFYTKTLTGTVSVTERGDLVYSVPTSLPNRGWRASKLPAFPEGRRTLDSFTPLESFSIYAAEGGNRKHQLLTEGEVKAPSLLTGFTFKEHLECEMAGDIKPGKESKTKVSTFHGNDPLKWKSGLKTYEEVSLGEPYPGIEVKLRADGNKVEKLFHIQPGADPQKIRMRFSGIGDLRVTGSGELEVETEAGKMRFTKPVAYQEGTAQRKQPAVISQKQDRNYIDVAYLVNGSEYGFKVGHYDTTRPLVIDPLLQSTFLGGNGSETAQAIAIHPMTGDIYITGDMDGQVFVSRLSSDLTTLLQTTTLGGSDWDEAYGIAIHPDTGDIYITGHTTSADFPGLTGAMDITFGGYNEAFVSRLSSDLQTLYRSTFLGGESHEVAYGIAIHPKTGEVYVTGVTNSTNFPNIRGGADTTIAGGEAFVSRLSSNLRTIYRSTFLGGSKYDSGSAIAIHPTTGNIYVTGTTGSNDFPNITGGADIVLSGEEAFVSLLSVDLSLLYQSTFLGGSGDDSGFGIAIHPIQGIYVVGQTFSGDFPNITNGADTTFSKSEAFVSRLSIDLKTLFQSTYLGGSEDDVGQAIAVHPTSEDVYVTGFTGSSDFPGTTNGADIGFGGSEAFVSRLSKTLNFLNPSTFLGGRSADTGTGIALDPITGKIYVTGSTNSSDFPRISGGADTSFSNWTFVTETMRTGTDDAENQEDLGTSANDFILQYGKGQHDIQSISGADGDDWLEQDGGEGNDLQTIVAESGNDFIYQDGGAGDDQQFAQGGSGNDWIHQRGGIGQDNLDAQGGTGNDYIHQSGGIGNDILKADGQDGDDLVTIDAGPGSDTITYHVSVGADVIFIDGGSGNDSLTLYAGTQDLTLKNGKGEILFQQGTGGSEIWIRSVENISVLDPDEIPIFEMTDASDITGGPDTSYREVVLGEAFVAMFDNLSSLYTLTVTKSGNGSGTATGPGINCGVDCRETYPADTPVTLTATADTDSIFAGWSGDPDCSDGQVTMNADKTCTATFNLLLGLPDLTGTWVTLTSSDGGKSVSGTLGLSNIGPVNAGTFKVAFYLSDDGTTLGNLLRTSTIRRGIAGGTTKNISFSTRSRIASLSGKFLIALIDSANIITESDENNNRAVAVIP